MKKRVLCLLTDGFEEMETVTPVDLLRRAEIEVVIASLNGGTVKGRNGITLVSDAALAELEAEEFDLLFIPGGPGVTMLRRDGRAAALARRFENAGNPVAAICAAPLVLKDAGLLEGRRFTAHFSTEKELGVLPDERVVEDGNLITSRGAGTAFDFGLALVARLVGTDAASKVSREVMA